MRAHACKYTQKHRHDPFSALRHSIYGSIFSQPFPFSFCCARTPPPFVITLGLKIPYVAVATATAAAVHPLSFAAVPSSVRVCIVHTRAVLYMCECERARVVISSCTGIYIHIYVNIHTNICEGKTIFVQKPNTVFCRFRPDVLPVYNYLYYMKYRFCFKMYKHKQIKSN